MTDSSKIVIRYHNVNGLSAEKLRQIVKEMEDETSPYVIYFIVETWYTTTHRLAMTNRLFMASSPVITRHAMVCGRQSGGILCLASDAIRPIMTSIDRHEYRLTITLDSGPISCVYLPPSMSPDTVAEILTRCPVGIVVGDFNARFGSLFNSDHRTPVDRVEVITAWAVTRSLRHVVPLKNTVYIDHCFGPKEMDIRMTCPRAQVATDHPFIIRIEFVKSDGPLYEAADPMRFNIRLIENEKVKEQLCEYYDWLTDGIDDVKDKAFQGEISIDDYFGILMAILQETSSHVLGDYKVSDIRRGPDTRLDSILTAGTTAEAIQCYKKSQRMLPTLIESSRADLTAIKDVDRHFREIFQLNGETNEVNTYTVGLENEYWQCRDILRVVKGYSNTKSCGSDGIHVRILKGLSNSKCYLHITNLFNLCLKYGYTPKQWNEAVVMPIPKTSTSKTIQDFRPISLTQMLRRLFEILLLEKLTTMDECSLHWAQAGFRHGYSTISQVLVAHDLTVNKNKTRIFIDLKQAYDRVPVKKLIELLKERNVPLGYISLIERLFTDCHMRVSVNGVLTERIRLDRGLLQGSPMSPFLFCIFIDPLVVDLNRNSTKAEPEALFYADDIQIVVDATKKNYIQYLLDVLHQWCLDNNMIMNIRKCGSISNHRYRLGSELCPSVKTYKYLGFPFISRGIDFDALAEMIHLNLKGSLRACRAISDHWPIWVRLAIFKTFICPAFEYGLALLYKKFEFQLVQLGRLMKNINSEYEDAVAWLGAVPTRRTNSLIRLALAVPCLIDRAKALTAGLCQHLNTLSLDNPLHAVRAKWQGYPVYGSLIVHCTRNNLYRDFQRHNARLMVGPLIDLKDYLKRWVLTQNEAQCPGMSESISSGSRKNGVGPIKSIYWPDSRLAFYSFRWRCNRFCLNYTCLCDERLTRGHLQRCWQGVPEFWTPYPIGNAVDSALNTDDMKMFERQILKMQERPFEGRPEHSGNRFRRL